MVAALASCTCGAPARFDASRYTTDQYEATSKDGTRVPYFVVHSKALKFDDVSKRDTERRKKVTEKMKKVKAELAK